jgi:hypothetical protein
MDPLDLTWIEFLQLLHKYIYNIGEQARWLPIVAFAYSVFEMKSQVQFWIDGEDPQTRQPMQPQLRRLLLASYRRRLFSVLLLSSLSGTLFLVFLLTGYSIVYGYLHESNAHSSVVFATRG